MFTLRRRQGADRRSLIYGPARGFVRPQSIRIACTGDTRAALTAGSSVATTAHATSPAAAAAAYRPSPRAGLYKMDVSKRSRAPLAAMPAIDPMTIGGI